MKFKERVDIVVDSNTNIFDIKLLFFFFHNFFIFKIISQS